MSASVAHLNHTLPNFIQSQSAMINIVWLGVGKGSGCVAVRLSMWQ